MSGQSNTMVLVVGAGVVGFSLVVLLVAGGAVAWLVLGSSAEEAATVESTPVEVVEPVPVADTGSPSAATPDADDEPVADEVTADETVYTEPPIATEEPPRPTAPAPSADRMDEVAEDDGAAMMEALSDEATEASDSEAASDEEAVAVSVDECGGLRTLEVAAISGSLSDEQIACMEEVRDHTDKQTDKGKISRLLLAHYQVIFQDTGRCDGYARTMQTHLEDIDRSDPELIYTWVVHLRTAPCYGIERTRDILVWSERALAQKSYWGPDKFKERVLALHEMRTRTAYEAWKHHNEKYLVDMDTEAGARAEEMADEVRRYAVEWYDYAEAIGEDTYMAQRMCLDATDKPTACRAE